MVEGTNARHLNTKDEIDSNLGANRSSYFDIIGTPQNVANHVHFYLNQIPDSISQVQGFPFNVGSKPYGNLIQDNSNLRFFIDSRSGMLELSSNAMIVYLSPLGVNYAAEEVFVHI